MGLVVSFMLVRDEIWFSRYESPNNTEPRPIALVSKSLKNPETQYSNNERKALGILCGLENFHHYYFTDKVSMVTEQNHLS